MKVNMGQPNDLLVDDLEQLLREVDDFNTASSNNKPADIPQSLENYLQFVAKSGNTVFPWPHVRSLFRAKMVSAIQQFQEPSCPNETFVLERFDLFRLAAPFTVQRLTELILQPTRHYRKKEKFLRGLEKTVLVVSTVEPRSLNNDLAKNGNEVNISISSVDDDSENSVFNMTFPIDRQEIISSVRTSAIDVITQSLPIDSSDGGIVLDPVTTSVVTAAVDVINQTIGVSAADTILPETVVTDSSVPAIDVISPEITIAVTSESIILDPVSSEVASAAASLVSIEAVDDTVTEMECESSSSSTSAASSSEVSPSLVQSGGEDLVSTAMQQAAAETLSQSVSVLEGVSSSLVGMDTVELAMDEDESVEPVVVSTETADASLFTVVSGEPDVQDDPALVQTTEEAIITSDDPLMETEVEVPPEPELADADDATVTAPVENSESSSAAAEPEPSSSSSEQPSAPEEDAAAATPQTPKSDSTTDDNNTIEAQQCITEEETPTESAVGSSEAKPSEEPSTTPNIESTPVGDKGNEGLGVDGGGDADVVDPPAPESSVPETNANSEEKRVVEGSDA